MPNLYLPLKNCILLAAVLFTFVLPVFAQPSISSFAPQSGPAGTLVTITGTGFSAVAANNIVYFGAKKANVMTASTTSLSVVAPLGATYEPITVTVSRRTAYSNKPFIVTFSPGGNALDTESFMPKKDFNSQSNPREIAIVDLNRDGKSDMIVTNQGSASASVFRNTGDYRNITFANPKTVPLGSSPYGVATGDFDGDGLIDMAVSINNNGNAGMVSIVRNTSVGDSINFGSRTDLAVGMGPIGISVADINKDGRPDVLVSSSNSFFISVFRNISAFPGQIRFAPRIDITATGHPGDLSVADLDADGKPDLASANFNNNISIWRNISVGDSIVFAARVDISADNNPDGIAIGDIDSDGMPDIAVSNYSTPSVAVFRNISSPGTFAFSKHNFPVGRLARCVGIGDVNGDDKPDLAVTTDSPAVVSVFRNISTAGTISFDTRIDYAVGSSPTDVAIGDMDNDGKADLAVTNNFSMVSILRNRLNEPVVRSFSPVSGGTGTMVTIHGTRFTGAIFVAFGGVPADSFYVMSDTVIHAYVSYGSSGSVIVSGPNGIGEKAGFVFAAPPDIYSFTPASGTAGTTVTIKGRNFTTAATVYFGDSIARSISVVADTMIRAVVGGGATGHIRVHTTFGMDSIPGFTYIPPAILTSFSPGSGAPGEVITLSGRNFTGITGVRFGGVSADSFYVVSDSIILAYVGTGATGLVTITTLTGSSSIPGFIFEGPPVVNNFNPRSVTPGTWVSIFGINLLGATDIRFGGIPVDSIVEFPGGSINVLVGNAASGSVSVTTPYGTHSLPGFTFINKPLIASMSSSAAAVGSTVTITGKYFGDTASNIIVYFGAVRAPVLTASDTLLTVKVPAGATYDPVTVTVNGLTAYSATPFTVTFPGAGSSFTPVSFASKIDVVSSVSPVRLAAGDMDGDGRVDVVVLNSSFITIHRNVSTGSQVAFAPATAFSIPTGGISLRIGDINRDGKPDIVTINNSSAISVCWNASTPGNINFPTRQFLPSGNTPTDVAIGDLDLDGRPDIVVTNAVDKTISVYRNTGTPESPGFSNRLIFPAGSMTARSIAIDDFDRDGKPDVAVGAYAATDSIYFLKNTSKTGSISFTSPTQFVASRLPWNINTGDLDADGMPDVAVANRVGNSLSVYRNTSDSLALSFAPKVDHAIDSMPLFVAIGDLDGDGKPEMAAAGSTGNQVGVYKNYSTAGMIAFAAKVDYLTGNSPSAVIMADIDNDGKPELITANKSSGTISVLRNSIGETMISPAPVITAITPANGPVGSAVTITGNYFNSAPDSNIVHFGAVQAAVTAATDTTITAIVPAGTTWQPVTVTTNLLTGRYEPPFNLTFDGTGFNTTSFNSKVSYTTGNYPRNVAMGDLDGDGRADLAVVNNNSNTLSIFRNTGATDSISLAARIDYTTGDAPFNVTIDDLDGDGKKEVIVADYYDNTISVYKNVSSNGSIALAPRVSYATGENPIYVTVGDLNADGLPEIVAVNNNSYTVSVFKNTSVNGNLSFSPSVQFAAGNWPWACSISDLNGDAKPDIVVANYYGNSISVLRNTGTWNSISFATKVDYATGNYPSHVFTGDLDGDSKPDIIVPNSDSQTFSIFKNISDSSAIILAPKTDYAAGFIPLYVAMGNLDGDGKPDLCVVNFGSNTISVFKNTSSIGTISLAPKVDYVTEMSPRNVVIGDLNGDGKPELAFINSNANSLSILRNRVGDSTLLFTNIIAGSSKAQDRSGSSIMVFPNPAREYTMVKHPANSRTAQLQIIDITGKIIRTQNVNKGASQTRLDTKGLSHGAYRLIWNDGTSRQSTTFVIQ
jgi:hypothetical protein